MKIAKIEQFFPRPRMRLVKITTDDGIVGWGESTLEGKPKSTMAAIEELADYLIGKDPLRPDAHQNEPGGRVMNRYARWWNHVPHGARGPRRF